MNGESVLSSALTSMGITNIGLYEVSMLLSLFGFGVYMMLASFHT